MTPALTDIYATVQGGTTYKVTGTQLGTLFVPISGGTMTGNLILNTSSPTTSLQAASKGYVDSVAQGLNVLASCKLATTVALTATYSNGASGVGATLTNAGAMAALSIDGVAAAVNDRILVKNQASGLQNGIYTVTDIGSGATNWVMTRATDYDTPAQVTPGDFVLVLSGTVNAQTQWVQTATVTAIGVDAIVWDQFGMDINALQTAIQNESYTYVLDTGAADAYVVTPTPAVTSYVAGLRLAVKIANANTGACTINVSGLGVKSIKTLNGLDPLAGDLIAGLVADLVYDGTNFQLLDRNIAKRIQNDSYNYVLDTGAADAYVATLSPAVTSYVAGQRLSLKIANANATTTPTVNVNALGAKTIKHTNGNALIAGDMPAGMIADLRYDGTNFLLLNPSKVITSINIQRITATGAFTYTPTSGTVYAIFELQGGGGGSGGTTGVAGQSAQSGAGGGGGYMKVLVTGAANLAAITGSVGIAGTAGASGNNSGGAGGNTTLTINAGSVWTATGGSPGGGQTSSASNQNSGLPGAGGSVTNGTNGTLIFAMAGAAGGYGHSQGGTVVLSQGVGGGSFLSPANAGFQTGGANYGGGAPGYQNSSGANAAGQAGAQGVVIITEFISA